MRQNNATRNSSIDCIDGIEMGLNSSTLLGDGALNRSDNHRILSDSLARSTAAKFGLTKTINVKCKNLKSYDLIYAISKA